MERETLYARLGGREIVTAAIGSLFARLLSDGCLGRFWEDASEDRIYREKQELIDLFCSAAGGPLAHDGHEMLLMYQGRDVSENDWNLFRGHLDAVLELFEVTDVERDEVNALAESVKTRITAR